VVVSVGDKALSLSDSQLIGNVDAIVVGGVSSAMLSLVLPTASCCRFFMAVIALSLHAQLVQIV
jgi:hypothetical protein